MKTEWTITVDHIACEDAAPGTNRNAVGMVGPSGAKLTHIEIYQHPERKHFRMFDDDWVLCYSGCLVGYDLFAPLDDFGTPNVGCTIIQIQNPQGVFETV